MIDTGGEGPTKKKIEKKDKRKKFMCVGRVGYPSPIYKRLAF
jgi:hypothetical protein